ncbi:MAG: hypothetical protein CMG57_08760 [Candidatus Marinimicrobia bacterium]|nr:hypothetical protein [Candidatus Neomarinimicrobiota bacterium]|tara:strand:- start:305 stop:1024 length:720 start_codon:yes stop_codon:yes gene_type:complete
MFGLDFINGGYSEAIKLLRQGKLMHVPSAPGLATINSDKRYAESLRKGDFAIPDSGYFVLLLKLVKNVKIKKYSGHKFLLQFFENEKLNKGDLFLIDPSSEESESNNRYLNAIGIPIDVSYHYVAPIYGVGEIEDKCLIDRINMLKKKPKYIMINLGSNVQEPLGCFLKEKLKFKVGIFGTGAAICFLTGTQASISPLVDNVGLGWFWRCLKNPTKFVPRYLKAIKLYRLTKTERTEIL